MKTCRFFLAGYILYTTLFFTNAWAAMISYSPGAVYTLEKGSQILRGCPICDNIPRPVDMTGTFRLIPSGVTPMSSLFEMQDIQFLAKDEASLYNITGTGTYEITGEFALTQKLTAFVTILGLYDDVSCVATNSDFLFTATWPEIQTHLIQSNGTMETTFELTIIASPISPQITQIQIDTTSGDITLNWVASGKAKLERSEKIEGPYSPIAPVTEAAFYIDPGAYKRQTCLFYRLH